MWSCGGWISRKALGHRLAGGDPQAEGESPFGHHIGNHRRGAPRWLSTSEQDQLWGTNFNSRLISSTEQMNLGLPDSRHLEQRVAEEVNHQLIASPGDILVFLPGKKEIVQCERQALWLSDLQVVKLHASVSDKERDLALSGRNTGNESGNRNDGEACERSFSQPTWLKPHLPFDIGVVIDSGLERRTVQRNGRTTLMLRNPYHARCQAMPACR